MPRYYVKDGWSDYLWDIHTDAIKSTGYSHSDPLARGSSTLGTNWENFCRDVHNKIRTGDRAAKTSGSARNLPIWYTSVLESLEEVNEFEEIRRRVDSARHSGSVSCAAAQKLLESLLSVAEDTQQVMLEKHELRAKARVACTESAEVAAEVEGALDLQDMLTAPASSAGRLPKISESGFSMKRASRLANTLANSSEFRKIMKLAGRMIHCARKKAAEYITGASGELHDIQPGRDIDRLVPTELARLLDDDTELEMLSDIEEGKALCYTLRSREPKSSGPIILLLDDSGSMRRNSKAAWSKAIALAMLTSAAKENRETHLIMFNRAITMEKHIKPGTLSYEALIKIINHIPHGGTDFGRPILCALDALKTHKKSDVILITDGEAEIPERIEGLAKSATAELGVAWYVIGIGAYASRACAGSLGAIAEEIFVVKDTGDTDQASSILNAVSRKP